MDTQRKIYMDAAATTYVSSEVLTEMLPTFTTSYGNSNSIHNFGLEAKALLEKARTRVATAIGAEPGEITFCSSGTEANNLAIVGAAHANAYKGKHIITTKIEHASVTEAMEKLRLQGFTITYLPVDSNGLVSIIQLLDKLRKDTILISVMMANNEVGTIQNIRAISKIANDKGIIFHTDAVSAFGYVGINAPLMGIDLLTISSHKIYGPKGAAALYVKTGIDVEPQIVGGSHENGLRAGSVDVSAVVGFGKAAEIAARDVSVNNAKLKIIRDYFQKKVEEKIAHIKINGHPQQRLPNMVNISFDMVEGEAILLRLADVGINVSTGSACTSMTLEPSHVLVAMGIDKGLAQGSIRFSFLKNTLKEDIDYTVTVLAKVVEDLRKLSPIKRSKIK